jgi:thiosulfate/3-mercaptopyruvate sulfurtransferase
MFTITNVATRSHRLTYAAPVAPSVVAGIGGVAPVWLERRLGVPTLRILDVRTEVRSSDASGTRLRATGNIELRPYAHLGGPPVWKTNRARHPATGGPSAQYLSGHVPGAIALDVRAVLFDDDGEVVSGPELALAMSSLGVGDEHTVVLVDEGRPDAALAAAWALTRYGHRDVHVLEGGFTRWVGEGREVSRELVRHAPASYTAKVPS